jgi:UDP-glucuronate 4-epimerase
LSLGHRVTCLDSLDAFYDPQIKHQTIRRLQAQASTPEQWRYHTGDIRHFQALQQLFQQAPIDVVVHLAARAGVRPSIEQPLVYSEVNIQGTLNVLECCRQYHVSQFLFGSSSSVYGARTQGPFSEEDDVSTPVSPYAATKRAGELLCATYAHLYHIRIACLRFFTVYGPYQRPDLVIHKFAKLLTAGQPLPVYGDGSTQRDYTYVDDIVEGILRAWHWVQPQDGATGRYGIFNLGGAQPVTLRELIHLLAAALECPAHIDWQAVQPGDVPMTFADLRKSHAVLGYAPQVDIATGIRRFAGWFKHQQ